MYFCGPIIGCNLVVIHNINLLNNTIYTDVLSNRNIAVF